MESRTIRYCVTAFTVLLLTFGGSACSQEPVAPAPAHDPGVRNDGAVGAGEPYPGLSDPLQNLFAAGQAEFMKTDNVKDDGLGPRMNLDRCGAVIQTLPPVVRVRKAISNFRFLRTALDHKTEYTAILHHRERTDARSKIQVVRATGSEQHRARWRCPRPVHHCRNEGRGKLQVYNSLTSKSS